VTKDRSASIYRSTTSFTPGGVSALERVTSVPNGSAPAERRGNGKKGADAELATGAALSGNQEWVAIRSHHTVVFFRTKDMAAGRPGNPVRVDVTDTGEPQGEAITFGPAGTIYLVGEGGKKGRPGTLITMTCALPE
jgi:hypothetical protein